MGKEKTTNETQQQQSQTYTPTAEEKELNQLSLAQSKELMPYETDMAKQVYGLLGNILGGGAGLPQEYASLFGGISPDAMGKEATRLTQSGLVAGQSMGIQDSGVLEKSIASDIAGNLVYPTEQYNQNMRSNLLNMALGYGGQQQQLTQQGTSSLSGALAGLRSMSGTMSGTQTITSMNPFLKSFQQSAGSSLGQTVTGGRSFSFGPFSIGGTS